MDASTSFAILPSNVKQKTAFERKVNQVKTASWANNCLTGTLDIGQFSCYFVNEKIARVTVNPFWRSGFNAFDCCDSRYGKTSG